MSHRKCPRCGGEMPYYASFCGYCGVKLSKETQFSSVSQCGICTATFRKGDSISKCPFCGAEFHEGCLNAWTQLNHVCPKCDNKLD